MIKVIVLIGQPGIGKSTLSMGLETAMQDVCDLCVIDNALDRLYLKEQDQAIDMGFASMQDPEYKKRYGKEKLEESRQKHGARIVSAYNDHKESENKNKDFVVLIHLPVREKIEQYQWTENDYKQYIRDAGYDGDIEFLPSIILTPNLKKYTKAETLAILNRRYEHRCGFKEMKTNQREEDLGKIALQRSLDAGLNVSRQYALIQMALRQLKGATRLRLDLNATIETSRGQLVDALKEILAGPSAVFRALQGNQERSA